MEDGVNGVHGHIAIQGQRREHESAIIQVQNLEGQSVQDQQMAYLLVRTNTLRFFKDFLRFHTVFFYRLQKPGCCKLIC